METDGVFFSSWKCYFVEFLTWKLEELHAFSKGWASLGVARFTYRHVPSPVFACALKGIGSTSQKVTQASACILHSDLLHLSSFVRNQINVCVSGVCDRR